MRILFTCAYYVPEKVAMTPILQDLAEVMAAAGHEVVISTPVPCRGINAQTRQAYKSLKREQLCGGKLIIKRFSLYSEGGGVMERFARYLLLNLQHLRVALFSHYDVLFEISSPPTQGLVGAMVKIFRHKKIAFNAQDIFPDSLVTTGIARREGMAWKIGRVVEKITYWGADKIIVISDSMASNIRSKGVEAGKIERVYNWVDTDKIRHIPRQDNDLFDSLKLDRNKFYVVYSGNLGYAQDMDLILSAAKECGEATFCIFGQGGQEIKLKRRAQEEKIVNVKFFPFQPYDKISHVYSLGNISLDARKPGCGSMAMPSKIATIMAAGVVPIVSFDPGTDVESIMTSNNVGRFTPAGDLKAFVAEIRKAINNPEQYEQEGKELPAFVKANFSKRPCTGQYVKIFEKL